MVDPVTVSNDEVIFFRMEIENSYELDDNNCCGHTRKISRTLSYYTVNGRIVFITVAGILVLFSLILFIVTVYPGAPSPSSSSYLNDLAPNPPLPSSFFPSSAAPVVTTTSMNNRKLSAETLSVTRVNGMNVAKGSLVWSDEFDYLDLKRWAHLNHDESNFFHLVNNRSNFFVKDGILHLKPTFTSDAYGTDYAHSVISTQESFTFRYGTLEIRAKMPAGD